jgi:DNA end-binding protein Ku
MARAIWSGFISFGLVNIPVELFPAVKKNVLQFHLLDTKNKSTIHYARINDITGKEVPWNQIVKGFEYKKGNYLEIKDEDFVKAVPEKMEAIEIEEFINAAELNFIYLDKPYFVIPTKDGIKGYILLREVLLKEKKIGIVKVMIRQRQYIGALMVYENILMLDLLRYHQELKSPKEFKIPTLDAKQSKIKPKELEMAQQLVHAMTTKWKPEKYHDEYHETLQKIIDKKLKKHPKTAAAKSPKHKVPEKEGKIVDFVELLQKSVKSKPKKRR